MRTSALKTLLAVALTATALSANASLADRASDGPAEPIVSCIPQSTGDFGDISGYNKPTVCVPQSTGDYGDVSGY